MNSFFDDFHTTHESMNRFQWHGTSRHSWKELKTRELQVSSLATKPIQIIANLCNQPYYNFKLHQPLKSNSLSQPNFHLWRQKIVISGRRRIEAHFWILWQDQSFEIRKSCGGKRTGTTNDIRTAQANSYGKLKPLIFWKLCWFENISFDNHWILFSFHSLHFKMLMMSRLSKNDKQFMFWITINSQ